MVHDLIPLGSEDHPKGLDEVLLRCREGPIMAGLLAAGREAGAVHVIPPARSEKPLTRYLCRD